MLQFLKAARFVVPGIMTVGALSPCSQAQTTPTQVHEGTMEAVPIDYEFSSAGTKVVVRGVDLSPVPYSSTDVITIWDSSTGLKLLGSASGGPFCGAAAAARDPESFSSDTVRVVGNTAVLIADDESRTRTVIDVVELGSAPGCLANLTKPDTIQFDHQVAGQAHDVEITPDGKFAVVNCRNWIFIVDLSASPPATVVEYNTASPTHLPAWASAPTEFWSSVDSVALTDNRGIAVQGAWDADEPKFFPIVYLIDFISSDPPLITRVDMQPYLVGHGDNFDAHDVAIVPVGDLAVVTCDNAVSLFDLATLSHVNSLYAPVARRYPLQVDSVELTDTHAVVIGGSAPTSIKVFDLRAGQPSGSPGLSETYDANVSDSRGAHDLDLFDRLSESLPEVAVIKAGQSGLGDQGEVYLLRSFTTTPTLLTAGSHGNPRLNAYGIPRVSDSVVAATIRVGAQTKRYGVSIGVDPLTQPQRAWIDLVDVDDTVPPLTVHSFPVDSPAYGTIPTDLAASAGTKRVFVRCQAPPDESPPATGGRDVLVVRLDGSPPFLEVGGPLPAPQIGGSGIMDNRNQADTMIVNRRRAVSVSQNDPTYQPQQKGYVHTSENN